MPQTSGATRQRQQTDTPKRYHVYLHNDDFTTMEMVVKILVEVFFKSNEEAITLMLQVHNSDKAIAGTYVYDIAASKIHKAMGMARTEGYPLQLSMEPEQ